MAAHPRHSPAPLQEPSSGSIDGAARQRFSMSFSHSKGLLNAPGQNNCFLNSAVQVLWHLDVFRRSFRHLVGHACMGNSCIFCALKFIFTQFQYSDKSALPPDALRSALAHTFADQQRFQLGIMDDAAECFETILLRIHTHVAPDEKPDQCLAAHCIPHRKFTMAVTEKVVCSSCGAASEPFSYDEMVYYVSTSALVGEAASEYAVNGSCGNFARLLRSTVSKGDVRTCPGNCGANCEKQRILQNTPDVVSIGLVWDSAMAHVNHIQDTMYCIGTTLHLQELFHPVARNSGGPPQCSTTLTLVGVVCYYGMHYSTYFFHSKMQEWIYFDDASVQQVSSDWEHVVDRICRGRHQPLLLLYMNPECTPINCQAATQTVTMVPGYQCSEGMLRNIGGTMRLARPLSLPNGSNLRRWQDQEAPALEPAFQKPQPAGAIFDKHNEQESGNASSLLRKPSFLSALSGLRNPQTCSANGISEEAIFEYDTQSSVMSCDVGSLHGSDTIPLGKQRSLDQGFPARTTSSARSSWASTTTDHEPTSNPSLKKTDVGEPISSRPDVSLASTNSYAGSQPTSHLFRQNVAPAVTSASSTATAAQSHDSPVARWCIDGETAKRTDEANAAGVQQRQGSSGHSGNANCQIGKFGRRLSESGRKPAVSGGPSQAATSSVYIKPTLLYGGVATDKSGSSAETQYINRKRVEAILGQQQKQAQQRQLSGSDERRRSKMVRPSHELAIVIPAEALVGRHHGDATADSASLGSARDSGYRSVGSSWGGGDGGSSCSASARSPSSLSLESPSPSNTPFDFKAPWPGSVPSTSLPIAPASGMSRPNSTSQSATPVSDGQSKVVASAISPKGLGSAAFIVWQQRQAESGGMDGHAKQSSLASESSESSTLKGGVDCVPAYKCAALPGRFTLDGGLNAALQEAHLKNGALLPHNTKSGVSHVIRRPTAVVGSDTGAAPVDTHPLTTYGSLCTLAEDLIIKAQALESNNGTGGRDSNQDLTSALTHCQQAIEALKKAMAVAKPNDSHAVMYAQMKHDACLEKSESIHQRMMTMHTRGPNWEAKASVSDGSVSSAYTATTTMVPVTSAIFGASFTLTRAVVQSQTSSRDRARQSSPTSAVPIPSTGCITVPANGAVLVARAPACTATSASTRARPSNETAYLAAGCRASMSQSAMPVATVNCPSVSGSVAGSSSVKAGVSSMANHVPHDSRRLLLPSASGPAATAPPHRCVADCKCSSTASTPRSTPPCTSPNSLSPRTTTPQPPCADSSRLQQQYRGHLLQRGASTCSSSSSSSSSCLPRSERAIKDMRQTKVSHSEALRLPRGSGGCKTAPPSKVMPPRTAASLPHKTAATLLQPAVKAASPIPSKTAAGQLSKSGIRQLLVADMQKRTQSSGSAAPASPLPARTDQAPLSRSWASPLLQHRQPKSDYELGRSHYDKPLALSEASHLLATSHSVAHRGKISAVGSADAEETGGSKGQMQSPRIIRPVQSAIPTPSATLNKARSTRDAPSQLSSSLSSAVGNCSHHVRTEPGNTSMVGRHRHGDSSAVRWTAFDSHAGHRAVQGAMH